MSVQVENLEHNMAKLTIEVAAEELEKALDSAYQKQKKQISVPGFRKGKVPRAMIEKMYGAGVFYEDAANILMQQTYAGAVDESGVDIVSRPTVEVTQIEKGQPFIYTAEVAVRPEVTLGKYMGVTVTKIDTSVSDEEVDAELENQRNKNARTVTVTDRPVAEGDTAVIDFEGFVDGVAFEGGKGENHPLEIGSHTFIDTFEDQLVGKNAGDEVEVNVTFPEKYQAADLAGKPATFKVKINEIKAKLQKLTSKKLFIDIKEIKKPDLDAQLVAENIAQQLENRISFRRAMKSCMSRTMKMGALGIKACCSGRLGGADMARTEFYTEGKIPLQTLRANIDYGFAEANTTYGKVGVKVWVYHGEVLPTKGNKEGSDK